MTKLYRALLTATALTGSALVAAVSAQETVLGPIIVSGGLTPFAQKEMGRSYTVIDTEQIERTKPAYVADLLRQVPGVAVSASGSVGSFTQVRMRGGEGNHVLVLIDGVPVSDNSSGEYDFGRLQVSNIERVEVLRGPQSAFWGSKALTGVINIITKSGARTGMNTTLATEFGTDGTRMGSVVLSYGQDNFDISGSVTARHTDGFNISTLGSERDGSTHFNADLKFNADITPTLSVDGVVRYGAYQTDTDGYDNALGIPVDALETAKGKEALAALGFKWESEDGTLFQSGRVSGTRLDKEALDDKGMFAYGNTGDTYKASYQAGRHFETPNFADSTHTITLGYDLVAETFNQLPLNAADMKSRTTHSVVGEYRGTFADQLNLAAALRYDINDRFANNATYSLSGAWDIPGTETTLHASLGTGAKNPSFYEQFASGTTFTGNPSLTPETSFGWDIGVRQALLDGMVTVDLTYFNQDLNNEIRTVYAGNDPISVYNAAGISTRQGIEVSALLDLFNGFTASGSYTYTDSRDPNGAAEVRRPMHSGVISVAYTFDEIPLTMTSDVTLVGEAKDAGKTLPAYALVNAGLKYQVSDNLEVYGRVQNLFDTSYQTIYGYSSPGRAVYVGAKASF